MGYKDTVFKQLLEAIPTRMFERLAQHYRADYRTRTLRCREQFLALMYAQLTGRKSLRDLEVSFNANHNYFYHLGCRGPIKRSTLSDANQVRPVALYQALFEYLAQLVMRGKTKQSALSSVSLLDASTIVLNKTCFGWATGHKNKSGIKVHTVYDLDAQVPTYFEVSTARKSDLACARQLDYEPGHHYVFDRGYYDFSFWQHLNAKGCTFVTRLKHNSPTQAIQQRKLPRAAKHILVDQEIKLNQRLSRSRQNPYQGRLREIVLKREDRSGTIRILTNNMTSSAEKIAALYKKRWQIELFFKWIKQNLKIKSFLGTSENAVRTQIVIAMITYLLLRIVQQHKLVKIDLLSVSRLMQTNLMRRINLFELLRPTRPPTVNSDTVPKVQQGFAFD